MTAAKPLPFDLDYVDKLLYVDSPSVDKLGIQSGLKNKVNRNTRALKNNWTGYVRTNDDNRKNWVVCIDNKRFLASRIIYLLAHGVDPYPYEIDHIDRNSLNNTVSNLRRATRDTQSQNRKTPKNNSSGVKGVSWHKGCDKWQAFISIDGRQKFLGRYDSFIDAVVARNNAVLRYWPEDVHEASLIDIGAFSGTVSGNICS